jgi:hypothetical protein
MDDELVFGRAADPLYAGASDTGAGRHETKAVEIAPEADRGPIAQTAARFEDGPVARLAGEVAAQPWLALGEERADMTLGVRPAAPPAGRHRHDHAPVWVDDDTQAA